MKGVSNGEGAFTASQGQGVYLGAQTKNARPCCHDRASNLVAKGGIEPPTQGFSVLCSTN